MKHLTLAVVIALIAGCTPPPETRGDIVALTDRTVTIRGPYDMSLGAFATAKRPEPTPGIIAQAREVCPNAKYLSANGDTGTTDTFDYLFQCR